MSKPDPTNSMKDTNRLQELAGLGKDKTSLADIDHTDFDNLREFVDFVRNTLLEKGKSDEEVVYELTEAVDSEEVVWNALDRVAQKNNLYYYADQKE